MTSCISHPVPDPRSMPMTRICRTHPDETIVIRPALPADDDTLRRLAALDSARPLTGRALVAESGGAVVAALDLDRGRAIADPFLPTADLVALLTAHAHRGRARRAIGLT